MKLVWILDQFMNNMSAVSRNLQFFKFVARYIIQVNFEFDSF